MADYLDLDRVSLSSVKRVVDSLDHDRVPVTSKQGLAEKPLLKVPKGGAVVLKLLKEISAPIT